MRAVLGVSLPNQWQWCELKHVTSVIRRGTAPNYVDQSAVRVIGQAANHPKGIDWSRTNFHQFSGDPKSLKGYLQQHDILINSTGTGTLGRIGYFIGSPDGGPCIADSHITIVRVKSSVCHPRFLYYCMESAPFQHLLSSSLTVGATNQIELSTKDLKAVSVPLPPVEEQRRIADFLDAETERSRRLISVQKGLIHVLLERRQATIYKLIIGDSHIERRPSTLPWVNSLPVDWKEVKINLVAKMGSGHTPSRSRPEWWVDCDIPWITTGEVSQIRDDRKEIITETRERISRLGLANSAAELHPAGTVVLCRTASVGYSAVMGTDMATSQDFVTWTCAPQLDPFYLLWCLRAMRPYLLGSLAMGSTHKTIYVPDLQSLRIPLPPISEQHEIVKEIRRSNDEIDRIIDMVNRQLDLLAERRQALITAAVTGQIDVTTAGRAFA